MREGGTFSQWKLIWLSTYVWDNIAKGHNKHTSSIKDDVILSCDYKNDQVYIYGQEKSKSNFDEIYWICYWYKQHININVTVLIYFSINILSSQYSLHDFVVNTISII